METNKKTETNDGVYYRREWVVIKDGYCIESHFEPFMPTRFKKMPFTVEERREWEMGEWDFKAPVIQEEKDE